MPLEVSKSSASAMLLSHNRTVEDLKSMRGSKKFPKLTDSAT